MQDGSRDTAEDNLRGRPGHGRHRWVCSFCHVYCTLTACAAFIEKVLNLDERGQYRIVTCGEEEHREST